MTIIDALSRTSWFASAERRRLVFGIAAFAMALFCVFPRHYRAVSDLAPQDTNTSGLSSIMAQLGGNYAALVGNHQPVEMDLTIARSYAVMEATAKKLRAIEKTGLNGSTEAAVRDISRKVTVSALRGSIIEIEVNERSPDAALALSRAYLEAIQDRLTQLSLAAADYKRKVLQNRYNDAAARVSRAEADITAFRTQYKMPSPQYELGVLTAQSSTLRDQLLAERLELTKALRFNGEESLLIKSMRNNIAVMQAKLDQISSNPQIREGLTAAGAAKLQFKYAELERELKFSQTLYDSYTRYLEGVALEEITSSFNMRVIQESYIDPSIQFNLWAELSLLAVIGLAAASELFMARYATARRFAR